MQQQATQRVLAEAAVLLLAPGGGLGEADLLGRAPGEGEFRRVLEQQDRPVDGLHAQADAWKWPASILSSLTFSFEKKR